MPFIPQIYKNITKDFIDLTSDETRLLAGNMIVECVKPTLEKIILEITNDSFDYTDFSFEKKRNSGLTQQSGVSLIINKGTKRIYLGGSAKLKDRRYSHKNALSGRQKNTTEPKAIREDLAITGPQSFYFVPLLSFSEQEVIGVLNKKEYNQLVSTFIDNYIEQPLLEYYLNSSFKHMFYNRKTTGVFEAGNVFGGSPESGQPSQAVSFENYAWESIMAAANSLEADRRTIRNRLKQNIMRRLTKEEFENFPDKKIFNANALTYFDDKPAEFNALKSKLFTNVFKKKDVRNAES